MTTETKKCLLSTPEWRLQIDPNLTNENVNKNDLVVVNINHWDEKANGFFATFGNNLKGFIPSDEVFLREYSEKKQKKSICFLIDKNVLTQVSSYNVDKETYILSRKKVLLERFSQLNVNNSVKGIVVAVDQNNIFVDIGAGFVSRINIKNISQYFVSSCRNIGWLPGDEVETMICSKNEKEYLIELSRRDFYPSYQESVNNFEIGQIVRGRILSRIEHQVEDTFPYAYYVEIIPNVAGIVNSWVEIPEGDEISGKISNIKAKGLKIRMLGLIKK